jgi:hypothetical protein
MERKAEKKLFIYKQGDIYLCFTRDELDKFRGYININQLYEISSKTDFDLCNRKISIQNEPHNVVKNLIMYNLRERNMSSIIIENILARADFIDFIRLDRDLQAKISSKGYNLIYDFIDLINGVNPVTKKVLLWHSVIREDDRYKLYGMFIICMQLFSDGNHRTTAYMLRKYTKMMELEINQFIKNISGRRNICERNGIYHLPSDQAVGEIQRQNLSEFYNNLPNVLAEFTR